MSRAVALRKESVDRNRCQPLITRLHKASLSARRAWIEIKGVTAEVHMYDKSLSARRAWIEIGLPLYAD